MVQKAAASNVPSASQSSRSWCAQTARLSLALGSAACFFVGAMNFTGTDAHDPVTVAIVGMALAAGFSLLLLAGIYTTLGIGVLQCTTARQLCMASISLGVALTLAALFTSCCASPNNRGAIAGNRCVHRHPGVPGGAPACAAPSPQSSSPRSQQRSENLRVPFSRAASHANAPRTLKCVPISSHKPCRESTPQHHGHRQPSHSAPVKTLNIFTRIKKLSHAKHQQILPNHQIERSHERVHQRRRFSFPRRRSKRLKLSARTPR